MPSVIRLIGKRNKEKKIVQRVYTLMRVIELKDSENRESGVEKASMGGFFNFLYFK